MGPLPRLHARPTLSLLLLCACNGGVSSARLPQLNLPASLQGGAIVDGPAAEQAYRQWLETLTADVILPLSIHYSLDARIEARHSATEVYQGSAVGEFHFQGIDAQRSRFDAFLVLAMAEEDRDWNLTGSLLFDGFFVRAWGTASGVPRVDPDKTYAVQFTQEAFENTYGSLVRLMPKFLNALEGRGIAGTAFLARDPDSSVVQIFHPANFLGLASSAFTCRSIRYQDERIYCTLTLNLDQDSPLRPVFQSWIEVSDQDLRAWSDAITFEEVFEARTGVLLSVVFGAEFNPEPQDPQTFSAEMRFELRTTDLEWRIPDLDRALARPDGLDPLDLTALLLVADKFLREKGDELEAEQDRDF